MENIYLCSLCFEFCVIDDIILDDRKKGICKKCLAEKGNTCDACGCDFTLINFSSQVEHYTLIEEFISHKFIPPYNRLWNADLLQFQCYECFCKTHHICANCLTICERDNSNYIRYEDHYFCQGCFNSEFLRCEGCSFISRRVDNMITYIDGNWYCRSCYMNYEKRTYGVSDVELSTFNAILKSTTKFAFTDGVYLTGNKSHWGIEYMIKRIGKVQNELYIFGITNSYDESLWITEDLVDKFLHSSFKDLKYLVIPGVSKIALARTLRTYRGRRKLALFLTEMIANITYRE